MTGQGSDGADDIAIVGMACRLPGARTPAQYWENLCQGIDSVQEVDPIEAAKVGVTEERFRAKEYIRRRGVLEGADEFDAHFFGMTAREAETTDPQHRLFLEAAVEALESAGHDPHQYDGRVGVFGGSTLNPYAHRTLTQVSAGVDVFGAAIGMDKDYLATKVSYRLALHGPSLSVQTACSTGLVAVHLSVQSLLAGECDMALAGAVSVSGPEHRGNVYEPGYLLSPDGACKAFSFGADGMVNGSGAVVLVLKRRKDAAADRDTIHALIKGSAINNDGADKVGFAAPSQRGQADVIRQALAVAGISPDSIRYVETHGTGTPLGDAIELAALREVFGRRAGEPLHIGSVKTNIGHVGVAAGVAGLLKAVFVAKHAIVPPHLHCATPSEAAREVGFFINNSAAGIPLALRSPIRVGVSSFGIGGTNAHVVVEQSPVEVPVFHESRPELVVLSAKTEAAVTRQVQRMVDYLNATPDLQLADVAYTLQTGRRALKHRLAFVCSDVADLKLALNAPKRWDAARLADDLPSHVVFVFPGGGVQYPGMGRDLYRTEAAFRSAVDECRTILKHRWDTDILTYFLADRGDELLAAEMRAPSRSAVCIFVYQYAMMRLLESFGAKPAAVVGHSQGEYACAVAASALALEDALTLVHARSSLLESLVEPGAMLVLEASLAELSSLLTSEVCIVALNAPRANVVAGPTPAIETLIDQLDVLGITFHRVRYGAASHCHLVEPVLPAFKEVLDTCSFGVPSVPWMSTVTADWLQSDAEVGEAYWLRQLREPVAFAEALKRAAAKENTVLVEIGPGNSLGNLIRSNSILRTAVCVSHHVNDARDDRTAALEAIGGMWLHGARVDWQGLHAGRHPTRVPLPTYPFDHVFYDYWNRSGRQRANLDSTNLSGSASLQRIDDPARWLYVPVWKEVPAVRDAAERECSILLFSGHGEKGTALVSALRALGHNVAVVHSGDAYEIDEAAGVVRLRRHDFQDHVALFKSWVSKGRGIPLVVHAWLAMDETEDLRSGLAGFHHVALVARALARVKDGNTAVLQVLTAGVHDVTGAEALAVERSVVTGCILAINQEFPDIDCRHLDIDPGCLLEQMKAVAELLVADDAPRSAALRGYRLWRPDVAPLALCNAERRPTRLRERGVYLITGGLGRLGLIIAEHLARKCRARLVLLSRREVPHPDRWPELLKSSTPSFRMHKELNALQGITDAGAELFLLSADVSNEAQMRDALKAVKARFGEINGVIHAAAQTTQDWLCTIGELSDNSGREQARTKVEAVATLSRLLAEENPDFVLLMSSLAALLGGIGYAAYAGANAAMDLFAHEQFRAGRPWLSVNWDVWEADLRSGLEHTTLAGLPMKVDEGLHAFQHVLALVGRIPQVAVSTADLRHRLSQWVLAPEKHMAPRIPSEVRLYSRPERTADDIGPLTDTEFVVAGVWQQMFGYERIGPEENFFDLGGHSLLAVRINSELRMLFRMELSLRVQFHHPTIRGLASALLDAGPSCGVEVAAVAATLREVSELTSGQLERLVSEDAMTT